MQQSSHASVDSHFARYGVPAGLRTDNGSNLVSEEMEKYLEEMGIVHHRNTPFWPEPMERLSDRTAHFSRP